MTSHVMSTWYDQCKARPTYQFVLPRRQGREGELSTLPRESHTRWLTLHSWDRHILTIQLLCGNNETNQQSIIHFPKAILIFCLMLIRVGLVLHRLLESLIFYYCMFLCDTRERSCVTFFSPHMFYGCCLVHMFITHAMILLRIVFERS